MTGVGAAKDAAAGAGEEGRPEACRASALGGGFLGVDPSCREVRAGSKVLRRGYTTGTCAALAAQAAARLLLLGERPDVVSLITPAGIEVRVATEGLSGDGASAVCGVRKDGGDDDDVTDGLLICAEVRYAEGADVSVDGGAGVGRVTKPGLEQPVGSAAINRVPRMMVAREVDAVRKRAGYPGGLSVTVSVPEGARVGARTFNPHLGIEGGISILGTSGIVEPRSLEALRASIEVEIRQAVVLGGGRLVVTPGNYGRDFVEAHRLDSVPAVQCANFIGDAIDAAVAAGARELLLVGHIGKLAKVAAGVMNTHSRVADCRCEVLCAHAALAGADRACAQALMAAATTDACLDILREADLLASVAASLAQAVQDRLDRRAAGELRIGAVVFDGAREEVFRTAGASSLLEEWEGSDGR